MKRFIPMAFAVALSACAGKQEYQPPADYSAQKNTITVEASKDEVWKKLIAGMGQKFFVINNMDKESGFINVSYSGDPELYVDCGSAISYVKNAAGERTYTYRGAQKSADFEIMEPQGLFFVHREMSLDGRINVLVQSTSQNSTTITVNSRYILTRTSNIRDVNNRTGTFKSDATFNTGQTGSFQNSAGKQPTICAPTGGLEKSILDLALVK